MTQAARSYLIPILLLVVLAAAVLWKFGADRPHSLNPAAIASLGLPTPPEELSGQSQLDEELSRFYRIAADTNAVPVDIAYLYHANGYYEQAIQSYPLSIDKALTEAKPRYLFALAALEQGDQDHAISELQTLAANQVNYPVAYLRLGDVLLKNQRLDEAADAYETALDKSENDFHAQIGLAQVYIQSDRWEIAKRWLLESIASNDSVSTPYTLLALVYGKTGNTTERDEALHTSYLKREYPEPVDPWKESLLLEYCYDPYQLMVTAEMASEAGRESLADALLQRVRTVASDDPKALVELGKLQLENQPSEARARFQASLELDPQSESTYLGLAQSHAIQGNSESAFETVKSGLRAIPKSSLLYNYLGELHLSERSPRQALIAFEKAFELNPMGLIQMRNLGSLLLSEGKEQRGEQLLQRYLTFQPDDQQVAGFYARWLLESKAEFDRAIEILERASRSVSEPSERTRRLLASAFHRKASKELSQRKLQQAALSLERSLSVWPENPEALANLGMIQAQLGQHDAAESALSRFTEMQPRNPVGWLNLGKARLLAERIPEAVEAWRKGVAIARETGDRLAEPELRRLIDRFSN